MIFWFRNFGARRTYACRKAMRKYKKEHPLCEITGKKRFCQVHHIFPVWKFPEKADDPNNFITLHRIYHKIFGHFGNFKKYNINIKSDAKLWQQKIKG